MNQINNIELQRALQIHKELIEYRDQRYLNMIQQINNRKEAIFTDDMGSKFVENCGRDLAGEIIRNCFDTSNYNITVDQMATRILKFTYEDEYDPLSQNGCTEEIQKNIYNYNELKSSELDKITADIDASQEKLFNKSENSIYYDNQYYIDKRKSEYKEQQKSQSADGKARDEYTGAEEEFKTRSDGQIQSRLDVDHIQDLDGATYNSKYLSEKGKEELVSFYNSSDNFALTLDSANRSKNAIKVYDSKGNDITHRATPEQMADAVCEKWENSSANTKQELIDKGYLNKDGTVPKAIRKKLVANVRHSQNAESVVILKNTKYDEVAKDAADHTKAAIGKIIAGQIIYYAAPPLVYEIRLMLRDKKAKLDDILVRLKDAAVRIEKYVLSKIKDIFKNVLFNSLKKFIKSFMDILLKVVKATVKKLLKVAKNLVLSTVDAIRIIADKNASAAEKADSVVNLFGVTITSCVIEVLFELASNVLHIPAPFDDIIFAPLQVLATVICTNLTMLILQKVDLFDVRFGFKVEAVKKVFAEERIAYSNEMANVERFANTQIEEIINMAKTESIKIYNSLQEFDPKKQSVRGELTSISKMFGMDINFESEWLKFMGIEIPLA